MPKFTFTILLMISTVVLADSHRPQEFLQAVSGKKNEGALIVQHFCSSCHAQKPMIQIAAPRQGMVEDWQPRLEKGGASLFKNCAEGINAMPPRGGCFECTDKQLVLAILALLPKSIKKANSKVILDLKKIKQ